MNHELCEISAACVGGGQQSSIRTGNGILSDITSGRLQECSRSKLRILR